MTKEMNLDFALLESEPTRTHIIALLFVFAHLVWIRHWKQKKNFHHLSSRKERFP